jgi:hypothetical protein
VVVGSHVPNHSQPRNQQDGSCKFRYVNSSNFLTKKAICVAPQMMDIPMENPMDAIFQNQKICSLVKNTITYKLKEQELSQMENYASPSSFNPDINLETDE